MSTSELTVDRWFLEVERVLKPHQSVCMDKKFVINVQIGEIASSSALENVPQRVQEMLKKRRGIVQTRNEGEKM